MERYQKSGVRNLWITGLAAEVTFGNELESQSPRVLDDLGLRAYSRYSERIVIIVYGGVHRSVGDRESAQFDI